MSSILDSFYEDNDNSYENKKKFVKQINTLSKLLKLDSSFDLDIRDKIGISFCLAHRDKNHLFCKIPKEILIMILNIAYPPITVEYLKSMAITLNVSYI